MSEKNPFLQNNSKLFLFAILIFGVLLRLPNLNESAWYDEVVYSTHIVLKDPAHLIAIVLFDKSAPFYRIFMFFWIKVFGDAELSIRIPSLTCGILSILLIYVLTLKFTEKKTALLTSFLLCLSPVHIWYSQEATPYSLLLFLFLTSIYSYYKLKESTAKTFWYGVYFLSFFLAVFTHYGASVYLVLISIMCLSKIDKIKLKVLILNLVILGCFISFELFKNSFGAVYTKADYLRPFTFFELWMLFLNWFTFGNSLWAINPYRMRLSAILQRPAMFCAQIIFLIIFIQGLILSLKKSKNSYGMETILYLFSLPAAMLGLSFVGFRHVYIERFLFIALPFFCMILAKGATGFKTKSIKVSAVATVIVFYIAALAAFLIKSDKWTVYKQNPDWRSAAKYFSGEIKNSREPLVIFAASSATELVYYDGRFKEHFQDQKMTSFKAQIYYCKKPDSAYLYRILSENGIKTFYLIKNKYWVNNFDEMLKNIRGDSKFSFVGKVSFKGLEIFKFLHP